MIALLGWFGFTILLLIIIMLHKKLNKQLLDLRGEISRLQIELDNQKHTDANLPSSSFSNSYLDTTTKIEADATSVLPLPLPQSNLTPAQLTNTSNSIKMSLLPKRYLTKWRSYPILIINTITPTHLSSKHQSL